MANSKMFCTNCGNKANETEKFCDKCGTKIEPSEKPEIKGISYYRKMSDEEYLRQNPKLEKVTNWSDKNKKKLYGIAILLFILGLLFMGRSLNP